MTYNRAEIMKRAWEIKKQDARYIFSLCLKMAWEEAKTMTTDEKINVMEANGFNRWTKGNMDRLYINARDLGLECGYYKTGNIRWAEFQGEAISNCEARRMIAAKTYVDVKTWTLHGTHSQLEEAAKDLMAELKVA